MSADLLYLDVGAWRGNGKSEPAKRQFGLVCGRTVVLADFVPGRPVALPQLRGRGGATLTAILRALAGPLKTDLSIRDCVEGEAVEGDSAPSPYLILPDTHFPVLATLPGLDPELIPDPMLARCACHGPIVKRMLYGSEDAPQRYRAVGATLSRNPNDWFFLLGESHTSAATDLSKLLDRLARLGANAPHIVQVGGFADLWTGFKCIFQAAGRMASICPTVVEDAFVTRASATAAECETLRTNIRDVVDRVLKLSAQNPSKATLLHGERQTLRLGELEVDSEGGAFEPPSAFLALREQSARFEPGRSNPGARPYQIARALRSFEGGTRIYVSAHTGRAEILRVPTASPQKCLPPPLGEPLRAKSETRAQLAGI